MEYEYHSGPFVLTLLDDPKYSPGSADNLLHYGREYSFAGEYQPNSKYGVSCQGPDGSTHWCILLAAAGTTRVNSRSAVIVAEHCFVAIGETICSLTLPELELLWARKVDSATCFGVYYLPSHNCLISHGELEIAHLSLAGDVVWMQEARTSSAKASGWLRSMLRPLTSTMRSTILTSPRGIV